jgi:hypothetical protein
MEQTESMGPGFLVIAILLPLRPRGELPRAPHSCTLHNGHLFMLAAEETSIFCQVEEIVLLALSGLIRCSHSQVHVCHF